MSRSLAAPWVVPLLHLYPCPCLCPCPCHCPCLGHFLRCAYYLQVDHGYGTELHDALQSSLLLAPAPAVLDTFRILSSYRIHHHYHPCHSDLFSSFYPSSPFGDPDHLPHQEDQRFLAADVF